MSEQHLLRFFIFVRHENEKYIGMNLSTAALRGEFIYRLTSIAKKCRLQSNFFAGSFRLCRLEIIRRFASIAKNEIFLSGKFLYFCTPKYSRECGRWRPEILQAQQRPSNGGISYWLLNAEI